MPDLTDMMPGFNPSSLTQWPILLTHTDNTYVDGTEGHYTPYSSVEGIQKTDIDLRNSEYLETAREQTLS